MCNHSRQIECVPASLVHVATTTFAFVCVHRNASGSIAIELYPRRICVAAVCCVGRIDSFADAGEPTEGGKGEEILQLYAT